MTETMVKAAERADLTVSKAAGAYRRTPAVRILGTMSEIADQPELVTINLATIAAGWLRKDAHLVRTGVHMLAAHALATGVKAVVKRSVDRTRPRLLVEEGRYKVGKGRHNEGPYNSFPSGHTAGAVAVARAIARNHPPLAAPVYAAAGIVALVQIPRCAHFVSDIAVGAIVGWAAEAATAAALKRLETAPAPSGIRPERP